MNNQGITRLATLNLANCFFGYEFLNGVFSGVMTDETGSQFITIPYRFVSLLLAVAVIWNARHESDKYSFPIWCLFIYWILLIFRFVDDTVFDYTITFAPGSISRYVMLIFGSAIPVTFAVIRSYKQVDYELLYKMSIFMLTIGGLCSLIFNWEMYDVVISDLEETKSRVGTIGLNPISLGHLGAILAILALFFKTKGKSWNLFLKWFMICLGLFLVSKAASRGPFVTLVACLCVYMYYKHRKFGITMISLTVICIIIWPFIENIVLYTILRTVSPSLFNRLVMTVEYGDVGRGDLIQESWKLFTEHPIFGAQFSLYKDHTFYYAHNIIVDSLVVGGIFGFIIFMIPFVKGIMNLPQIMQNNHIAFVGMICIAQLIGKMFSGNFYMLPQAGVAMALLVLLIPSQDKVKQLRGNFSFLN